MPSKRKHPNVSENEPTKVKRAKFVLEDAKITEIPKQGNVFVMGEGDVGQLGLGPDILEKTRASAVTAIEESIVDVCAGGMHTVCLTKDGNVITFGCNDEGALGRLTEGIDNAEFSPGAVQLPGKVVQISAGDSHTAALLEDGRVFAWGTFRDSHGNLGLTLNGNEKFPYEILKNVHVVKIASGEDHLVFLTKHGEVFTCGRPEQGQLGRLSIESASRTDRTGLGKGRTDKFLYPRRISLRPTLKCDNIWAGTYSTFIKVSGKNDIYACGLNNYHQLGLEDDGAVYFPKISKSFSKYTWRIISSAEQHSIAVTESGKTYAIGRKEYGRLGLGEIKEDASELTEIPTLKDKNVVIVSCGGSSTSFAVTDKGVLYSWGMATNGQLGTGSEEDVLEPTEVKGKQILDKSIMNVSGGGQHTVLLAIDSKNNIENNKNKKLG